jgi:hypothetical protein
MVSQPTPAGVRLPHWVEGIWFREIAKFALRHPGSITIWLFFFIYIWSSIILILFFDHIFPFHILDSIYHLVAATIAAFCYTWLMKLHYWGKEQAYLDDIEERRGFLTYNEWTWQQENPEPSFKDDSLSVFVSSLWAGLVYACILLVISEIALPLIGVKRIPLVIFILGSIVSYKFAVGSLSRDLRPKKGYHIEDDKHIRGHQIIPFEEANRIAEEYHPPYKPGLLWNGLAIPFEAGQQHFLYAGTTGAGKTKTILLLMTSVLNQMGGKHPPKRAFIYDPKCDMVPRLASIKRFDYQIINPFDTRGWAWDIAADCTDESSAKILAAAFAPDPPRQSSGGGDVFFQTACQNIIVRVLMFLNSRYGRDWSLSDLCQAAGNRRRLLTILTKYSVGAETDALLENRDVFPVLVNHIQKLETVANLWSHTEQRISLRQWMRQQNILLLTFRQQKERDLMLIYPIMFRALVDIVLDEGKMEEQTWFFVDEVQSFGNIPGLSKLMRLGREKGACVVLGMHEYEGFREIYGSHQAEEILGLCNHAAILKVLSVSTAEWAARRFGVREYFEDELTTSRNNSTTTTAGHSVGVTSGRGVSDPTGDSSRTRSRNRSSTTTKNSSTSKTTSTGEASRRFKREEGVVLASELMGQKPIRQIQALPAYCQGDVGCFQTMLPLSYVHSFSLTREPDDIAASDLSSIGFQEIRGINGIHSSVARRWQEFDRDETHIESNQELGQPSPPNGHTPHSESIGESPNTTTGRISHEWED